MIIKHIYTIHVNQCVSQQFYNLKYSQISNMIHTFVGNKLVDHSDVVGAVPRRCSNYIFILDLTPDFNG